MLAAPAGAQDRVATDVTTGDITAFIDALPRDRVSDRPIRVVDVGGYQVGGYRRVPVMSVLTLKSVLPAVT